MSEIIKYNLGNVGYERFISDVRQLGGFLMVFGVCVMTLPQSQLAMWLGHESNPDLDMDDLHGLMQVIGGLCAVLVGATSFWVGYLAIGHDCASKWLTRLLVGITVLLFIPFGTELADVVKNTSMGPDSSPFFANPSYDPTNADVRFVGSMGFIGVLGWYGGMIASLAFCQRALFVFAKGQPELRSRAFYQSRLVFFSVLMLMAGVSQLLIGVYLLMQYGSGAMPYGAVRVAMYVVYFPDIAIAVGGFQTLTAILGLLRAAGKFPHPDNHIFQVAVILSWLGTLVGTTMIQIYYSGPRMMDATRAPTMVVLTMGLNVLPSFLDFKMRNLPFTYPEDFYDPPTRNTTGGDKPERDTDEDNSDGDDGLGCDSSSINGDKDAADNNNTDTNSNVIDDAPDDEAKSLSVNESFKDEATPADVEEGAPEVAIV
jgi:hypothetical protein